VLATVAVGEFALAERADEQADELTGPDQADLGRLGEARLDHVGDQRAEDGEVDDVEEIGKGDERENAPMDRTKLCLVELCVDVRYDRLRHGGSPLFRRRPCRQPTVLSGILERRMQPACSCGKAIANSRCQLRTSSAASMARSSLAPMPPAAVNH